jgi:ribosome biogenesis GTPase
MAKRKLSQHQQKRIQSAQDAASGSDENHMEGLVISHHGGKIIVEAVDGQLIECAVRSNLGAIVCGDRVVCESTGSNQYRVIAILTRENFLQRIDGFGAPKSVAANLSQLLVCLAVLPEPNLFLLDQYLISAEQQHIDAVIVLNKLDLLPVGTQDPFSLEAIYAPLGYKVLSVSVKSGLGMAQLRSVFDNHTSVLSGVSGVGKSSITQAMLPHENIKIAEISATSDEGRHTTRTSRLYHLPNHGHLIDTPGIRGFKPLLAGGEDRPISTGFREISDFAAQCHFSNCRHVNEPGCAVLDAVAQHKIAESRYQHYLKMLDA